MSNAVDTTGAGDVYAAGFLYGFFNDLSIANAGYLGSLMASKVIEIYGAKIPEQTYTIIKNEVARLRSI
jgi:sugar/nucleoside kinase (ribokinase family)